MSQPLLRLLADDLTGALDSAAELAGLCGPMAVRWDTAAEASCAFDSSTREAIAEAAAARVRVLAPALAGADLAFKKLDSLLRGQVAAELAACFGLGAWRYCIFAPAFPAQGRITRGGRQWACQPGNAWEPVGPESLVDALRAVGLPAHHMATEGLLLDGVTVLDAETEADLYRIAALGQAAGAPVLWCGSGGLARALAGPARLAPDRRLVGPVLGLFGSDQAVTARQLAACGPAWEAIDPGDAAGLAGRLVQSGIALASLALPPGLPREVASKRIAAGFAAVIRALPRPGTLLAAGGETLRAICEAVGATALRAEGLVGPGVPRSTMLGGAWDGVVVVSKSGAFGGDTLWRDLLAENGLISEGADA